MKIGESFLSKRKSERVFSVNIKQIKWKLGFLLATVLYSSEIGKLSNTAANYKVTFETKCRAKTGVTY